MQAYIIFSKLSNEISIMMFSGAWRRQLCEQQAQHRERNSQDEVGQIRGALISEKKNTTV